MIWPQQGNIKPSIIGAKAVARSEGETVSKITGRAGGLTPARP
jgi:hypothetical protein